MKSYSQVGKIFTYYSVGQKMIYIVLGTTPDEDRSIILWQDGEIDHMNPSWIGEIGDVEL